MAPKKKDGKAGGRKKGSKPAWMSDTLYEVSQNLPELVEHYK